MQEAKMSKQAVVTGASTVEELFQEMRHIHHFSLSLRQVRVFSNKKLISDWKTAIFHGDHILFIPPLVGG
jgi:molybdopterin converting factor small subunit